MYQPFLFFLPVDIKQRFPKVGVMEVIRGPEGPQIIPPPNSIHVKDREHVYCSD